MKKEFAEGYNLNGVFTLRIPDFHKKYVIEQCKDMGISVSEYFRTLILNDYRKYNR